MFLCAAHKDNSIERRFLLLFHGTQILLHHIQYRLRARIHNSGKMLIFFLFFCGADDLVLFVTNMQGKKLEKP